MLDKILKYRPSQRSIKWLSITLFTALMLHLFSRSNVEPSLIFESYPAANCTQHKLYCSYNQRGVNLTIRITPKGSTRYQIKLTDAFDYEITQASIRLLKIGSKNPLLEKSFKKITNTLWRISLDSVESKLKSKHNQVLWLMNSTYIFAIPIRINK